MPIAEITSLICQILESNGVLQNLNTTGWNYSTSGLNLKKLMPPMDSRSPKTLGGATNLVENIALEVVPKYTQTKTVITTVSELNSAISTQPLSSNHLKTLGGHSLRQQLIKTLHWEVFQVIQMSRLSHLLLLVMF